MMRLLLSGMIFAALAGDDGAAAKSAGEIVRAWGLEGTWSADCSRPAGMMNGYQKFIVDAAGSATLVREFGYATDSNPIREAEVDSSGVIVMRIQFPEWDDVREVGMMKSADGQMRRTVFSRDRNGNYSARDGKTLPAGNPLPWLHKCD